MRVSSCNEEATKSHRNWPLAYILWEPFSKIARIAGFYAGDTGIDNIVIPNRNNSGSNLHVEHPFSILWSQPPQAPARGAKV